MKPVTMILLLAALVSAPVVSCQTEWSEYKIKYNKNYNEEDEELRKSIFEKSKMQVEEHNKKFEEGLVSFTIGLNKFSDMTHEEYLQKHPAIDISSLHRRYSEGLLNVADFPDRLDWRKEGAVTRVKDQQLKKCSFSDWTFSVTGAVEGLHYIKTNKLTELSEQNIIDCNGYFNDGCRSGISIEAYKYIIKNNGIDTEASYPYEAKQGECRRGFAQNAVDIPYIITTHFTPYYLPYARAPRALLQDVGHVFYYTTIYTIWRWFFTHKICKLS